MSEDLKPKNTEFTSDSVYKYVHVPEAWLQYFFDEEENCYRVDEMGSNQPGQGKELIRKLISTLGHNQYVHFAGIIERETLKTLSQQGSLDHVEQTGKTLEIKNPAVFKSLKVTNTLVGGGIKIEKVRIKKIPDNLIHDLGNFQGGKQRVMVDIYGWT